MSIIDTRRLSLDNKTIAEWHQEVRAQAHNFRNKYERCFNGTRYSISMMQFYRRASDTYFQISEVLQHLNNYDSVIDTNRCLSCKNDNLHIARLEREFKRFYPLIIRCRDGYRFKKNMVLTHDV